MWDYFWKDFVLLVAGFLAVCALVVMVVSLTIDKHPDWVSHRVTVQYDCRLAEISPDYPPMVKELCREKIAK